MGLSNGSKSRFLNCKKTVLCKFSQRIEVQTTNHWYIHFANLPVCFWGRVGIFFFYNRKADMFWAWCQSIKIGDNKFLYGMFVRDDEGQWRNGNRHLTYFTILWTSALDFKSQQIKIVCVWRQSSHSVEISPGRHLHKLRRFLANFANFPGKLTWCAMFIAFCNFTPPRLFLGQGPVFLQKSFFWYDFLCQIPVISWVFPWRKNASSRTNLGAPRQLCCRSGPASSLQMFSWRSMAAAHEIGASTAQP